ncbi:MAG: SCO family protein [Acidobacteria bacterium]|nr:SCO family protein [Acidobacteriota bacterium]
MANELLLVLLFSAISCLPSLSQELPQPLSNVGFDQKLNAQLPLDVQFRDEAGKQVRLGQYFGDKPVIISFAYYTCPMLCKMILDGMARGLSGVPGEMGKDYFVVNISIDPRDGPDAAREKKIEYVRKCGPSAEKGWIFLTGEEPNIRAVADATGFRYSYDPQSKQYGHVSGIVIATPRGRISRYFYGISYSPLDLRLGLAEASEEKIGSPVNKLLLFCYYYDALTGKYSLVVTRVVQVAGVVTVLLLGLLWLVLHRRAGRNSAPPQTA